MGLVRDPTVECGCADMQYVEGLYPTSATADQIQASASEGYDHLQFYKNLTQPEWPECEWLTFEYTDDATGETVTQEQDPAMDCQSDQYLNSLSCECIPDPDTIVCDWKEPCMDGYVEDPHYPCGCLPEEFLLWSFPSWVTREMAETSLGWDDRPEPEAPTFVVCPFEEN